MFKKIKGDTTLFLTAVFALGLIGFFSITYQHEKMTLKETRYDTAFYSRGEQGLSSFDLLPHYKYMEIKDSLDKIEKMIKDRNTLTPRYTVGTGFIGASETTSYWYGWYGDNRSHIDSNFYIYIPNYALHPEYRFEYRDHKNYLRRKYSDTTEIGVAYLPRNKAVLVPIQKGTFIFIRNLLAVLLILAALIGVYIYIILPIVVLINISAGNVFTKKNIRNLYILAYTTLGYVLIELLMPYVIGLLFMKKIPDQFVISFYDVFMNQGIALLIGTILLAIASAFAKGYKLQQDQDLTI